MYQKEMNDILAKNALDYAKYTITDRAIVNLSDGLKNIHRRIIWSMYLDGLLHNKSRTKSVNAVGSVLRFSPHGDASVYQACVRLANDSVMIPIIDGKGSFSSTTTRDIQAGAARYTEMRLSPITQEILKDINKDVVDMVNNYDDTRLEPLDMPVTFPLVLANPNIGIAVGIASNIISFNLNDIVDNTINLLKNKETFIMIPDLPTGGLIKYDERILRQIKDEGTGTIYLRAKYHIENNSIVVTEIPYTTTREAIVESIINLVKDNKIKEIIDVNDYSGVDGLNITIDTKKNTNIELLMSKLYKLTPLQNTFSCNFTMLLNNKPVTFGTDRILKEWILFRQSCIKRGIQYDVNKKSNQLHLLKGLEKVLLDIDSAISIIRHSKSDELIISNLMSTFLIDDAQANEIANMKLRNINENYILNKIKAIKELENEILELKVSLTDENKINDIIIVDLERVKKQYGKPRMTEVLHESEIEEINKIDFVPEYNTKLFLSEGQYLKKIPLTSLRGKGTDEQKLKDGDKITQELDSTNKSSILLFTNKQNRYKLNAYDIEDAKPSTLGSYIPNLIDLEPNEKIIKIVSLEDESKAKGYILSVYSNGKISKVDINSFISANKKLQNCYSTESELLDIEYIEKDVDVLMISSEGKGIIVNSEDIGSKASRNSQGNIAMNLGETEGNKVISCMIKPNQSLYFTLNTEKGKSKEFRLDDIAPTGKDSETRDLYTYIKGRARNQGNFLINLRSTNDSIKEVMLE